MNPQIPFRVAFSRFEMVAATGVDDWVNAGRKAGPKVDGRTRIGEVCLATAM